VRVSLEEARLQLCRTALIYEIVIRTALGVKDLLFARAWKNSRSFALLGMTST
jgi:hypothetical protein